MHYVNTIQQLEWLMQSVFIVINWDEVKHYSISNIDKIKYEGNIFIQLRFVDIGNKIETHWTKSAILNNYKIEETMNWVTYNKLVASY